ncbi:MAG: RHS repeat-associated core domain-containing protein [Ruminiclostridium sp.]
MKKAGILISKIIVVTFIVTSILEYFCSISFTVVSDQITKKVYGINLTRSSGSVTMNYMYNDYADVTSLLKTDRALSVTYYYDTFENILKQAGSDNNSITYAGYRYVKETAPYYPNARCSDSKTARFISEDTYLGEPEEQYSTVAQGLLIYYGQQWNYYNNLAKNTKNAKEKLAALANRDKQHKAADLARWEDKNTNKYEIKGVAGELIDKNGEVLLTETVTQKDGTKLVEEIKIQLNGQEKDTEGYGQIVIPELYVYTKVINELKSQSPLSDANNKAFQNGIGSLTSNKTVTNVPYFTMNDLVYGVNNCVLIGTTRIIQTLINRYSVIGDLPLKSYNKQVYDFVESIAKRNYNYSNEAGVPFPIDNDNLVEDALNKYGFLLYDANNKYLINANFNAMKKSVDDNMPFLLNCSAQYVNTECVNIHVTNNPTYTDHTVTGIGYQEYSTVVGSINLIKVYDGWSSTPRYIDYDEFVKDAKVLKLGMDGYSITIVK